MSGEVFVSPGCSIKSSSAGLEAVELLRGSSLRFFCATVLYLSSCRTLS